MKLPKGELAKVEQVLAWLPKRMREIREARGFTQAKLAEAMNCHFTRVSDFEAFRSDYKLSTACRAAYAMGVSMEQVFKGCPGWKGRKAKPLLVIDADDLVDALVEQGYEKADVKKAVDALVLKDL